MPRTTSSPAGYPATPSRDTYEGRQSAIICSTPILYSLFTHRKGLSRRGWTPFAGVSHEHWLQFLLSCGFLDIAVPADPLRRCKKVFRLGLVHHQLGYELLSLPREGGQRLLIRKIFSSCNICRSNPRYFSISGETIDTTVCYSISSNSR